MTAHAVRTRRMVLRDMGKAGLAILILGSAACSDDAEGDEPTTSSGAEPSTTAADTMTSSTPTETTRAPQGSGHDWHRVNLGFVSAYIVYRNGEAVQIDTGVGGSTSEIGAALQEAGLGWEAVGNIVITQLTRREYYGPPIT